MKAPHRIAVSTAAATLLLAVGASAGQASPTRTEYVGQVEPICEANTLANKRILKNVREKARSQQPKKVRQAGGQFIRASAAFGETVRRLASVPRPPEDDARLLRWLAQLRIVKTNLRKLGVALQDEDKIRAAHEQVRVERSSNAANNFGFVFGFDYCRLTPSRFT
jgi:hypothetical protein